jgi:hypothetical protein
MANIHRIYIYIYIYIYLCVCVCVCVFQNNLCFGTDAFQMDIFPQVSPPKSIRTSLVFRTCYMFQTSLSHLFVHTRNILCIEYHEASHRSISTSPPLPRLIQGQILRIYFLIILRFRIYLIYIRIFHIKIFRRRMYVSYCRYSIIVYTRI